MLLKNGKILNGKFETEAADIRIGGNLIEEIGIIDRTDPQTFDIEGCTAVPGFIDIHTHGSGGDDACDLAPEIMNKLSKRLAAAGVTTFTPATMSLSHPRLVKVMENIASSSAKLPGARVAGIHLEGPYLSDKRAGAHDASAFCPPSEAEVSQLYKASKGLLKIISLAPELPGALEFIEKMSRDYIISVAHTAADYDLASTAFLRGASHVTHLYNAMTGFSHREPGVVGAVFDSHAKPTAELICDGHHIHPAVIRSTFKMLGRDRIVAVSDSTRAAGMPDGEFSLGGVKFIKKDGVCRTEEGNLAGSNTNLHESVKNLVSFGVPLELAVRTVSINPARVIGIDKHAGSLEIGKQADVVVLDKSLNIKMIIIGGKLYNRGLTN